MKTTILLAAFILLTALVRGEDPKGAQALIESQAPKKAEEPKKTIISPPKSTNEVLGTPVVYGGYLSDLAKAEKKRPLFNLKTPFDPQKDLENYWSPPSFENRPVHRLDPEPVHGFVLFSVKF
jgi:hypothetical protein